MWFDRHVGVGRLLFPPGELDCRFSPTFWSHRIENQASWAKVPENSAETKTTDTIGRVCQAIGQQKSVTWKNDAALDVTRILFMFDSSFAGSALCRPGSQRRVASRRAAQR